MTPEPVPPPNTVEIEDRAERVAEHAAALQKQPRTLKDLIRSPDFLKAVAEVAPEVMKPSRFVRAALTAMMRTPLLAECTRDSFFQAMLDCAFYGLEPDRRRAHLIPFKNNKRGGIYECQLIIDYKGLAELVRRSGEVSFIHADCVYGDDSFEVSYGTGSRLVHEPGENRTGKPLKFYSYVKLRNGDEDFDVMTLAEVERIRKRSKSPDAGPWATDFSEMGKKTVFRRHSKWLPLTAEARFNLDRSDPEAVEGGPALEWSDLIGDGESAEEQPQRLSARERVLNPPNIAADEGQVQP
jgi:recombination protein RecT